MLKYLSDKKLKVTPQRVAVLEAIISSRTHPTAENIIEYVSEKHPNIGKGTVYRVLETLVKSKIIGKVKTDSGVMRYDPVIKNHHHLYCVNSDRIEDYEDDEINGILEKYFSQKNIKGFKIEDIRLQIIGKFKNNAKRIKS